MAFNIEDYVDVLLETKAYGTFFKITEVLRKGANPTVRYIICDMYGHQKPFISPEIWVVDPKFLENDCYIRSKKEDISIPPLIRKIRSMQQRQSFKFKEQV